MMDVVEIWFSVKLKRCAQMTVKLMSKKPRSQEAAGSNEFAAMTMTSAVAPSRKEPVSANVKIPTSFPQN